MGKEKILDRTTKENIDEGKWRARSQGHAAGCTAFTMVFIFIVVLNKCVGAGTNPAVYAMFAAFVAAEAYPMWRFTKGKKYLLITVGGGVLAIAFLAEFVTKALAVVA